MIPFLFVIMSQGHPIAVCGSQEMAEAIAFLVGPTKTELTIEQVMSYIDVPVPVLTVTA